MGNSSPYSKNLKIHIETEKPFYNAGSSIEGAVFVEVKQNFKFDALYIRVQGDQWCQWFEGTSKNRVKYTGSDHFYSIQYLLMKFEDQHLAQGKYVYPFSIELSQNLPGSFQSAKFEAKIEYKLVAYFASYDCAQQYQVCSLPLLDILSYQGESSKNPMGCGCCCSQGQVTLSANFERNVCFQGEKVRVDMNVNNRQGTSEVYALEVRLVQYTFISANNGVSRTYKHTIYKHIMDKRILKGQQKKMSHELQIPTVAHQTAISTLVANYYRIEVTCNMGLFATENPSIYAPLFVLKKSFNLKNSSKRNAKNKYKDSDYQAERPTLFRAPDYWFKKNRNLSVMNFRFDDIIDKPEQSELKQMDY